MVLKQIPKKSLNQWVNLYPKKQSSYQLVPNSWVVCKFLTDFKKLFPALGLVIFWHLLNQWILQKANSFLCFFCFFFGLSIAQSRSHVFQIRHHLSFIFCHLFHLQVSYNFLVCTFVIKSNEDFPEIPNFIHYTKIEVFH